MASRTVGFNKSGIGKLPNDKPVVYRIQTEGGRSNYIGVAQRGRVQARLQEHLDGGKNPIPGVKVKIEQMSDIGAAREKEANIISRAQPKYNQQGK